MTEDTTPASSDGNAAAPDSLRLRLAAPERVAPGEPVPVTLRAENVTEGPLELHLRGREIAFDLVAARPDGTVVWRRLEEEVVPAILRLETLAAGEALALEAAWDQRTNEGGRAEPGAYLLHGELLTDGEPLVTPAETLRIVAAD